MNLAQDSFVTTASPPELQIRRLRIQIRLKTETTYEEDVREREYDSAVPGLPPLVSSVGGHAR